LRTLDKRARIVLVCPLARFPAGHVDIHHRNIQRRLFGSKLFLGSVSDSKLAIAIALQPAAALTLIEVCAYASRATAGSSLSQPLLLHACQSAVDLRSRL